MSIAAKIKRYLDAHRIGYQIHSHTRTQTLCDAAKACNIPFAQLARTILLRDKKGLVLVTLSLDSKLNFFALSRLLHRNLELCSSKEANKYFNDCEPGSHPPLGEPYHILTVVDDKLLKQKSVYFEPGTHSAIVQLQQDDFSFLMSNAIKGPVSVPLGDESAHCHWDRQEMKYIYGTSDNDQKRNENKAPLLFNNEALPKAVQEIIHLAKAQESNSKNLADILQSDPLLTRGLQLFAHLKGKDEHQDNVALCETIRNILDFDTVTHIAAGCSSAQKFRVNTDGPLGLHAIWAHALCSSQVCYKLAEQSGAKLDTTTAYLCGLFQNIGFLLYGHLFGPEFRLLNKWVKLSPKQPITLLEQRLLGLGQAQLSGCSHAQMGGWLMEKWGLPESVVVCTYRHHEQGYTGPYHEYVMLIQAANQCLLEFNLGDGQASFDWNKFQEKHALTYEKVYQTTELVMKNDLSGIFNRASY